VLLAQKQQLLDRLEEFKKNLAGHQQALAAGLQGDLDRSRMQITEYYVPIVMANPPDSLRGGVMGSSITEDNARSWISRQLESDFPVAEKIIGDMHLDVRFKDVTFETLNMGDFLDSVKTAFPLVDWDTAYEVFRAAGERT